MQHCARHGCLPLAAHPRRARPARRLPSAEQPLRASNRGTHGSGWHAGWDRAARRKGKLGNTVLPAWRGRPASGGEGRVRYSEAPEMHRRGGLESPRDGPRVMRFSSRAAHDVACHTLVQPVLSTRGAGIKPNSPVIGGFSRRCSCQQFCVASLPHPRRWHPPP